MRLKKRREEKSKQWIWSQRKTQALRYTYADNATISPSELYLPLMLRGLRFFVGAIEVTDFTVGSVEGDEFTVGVIEEAAFTVSRETYRH